MVRFGCELVLGPIYLLVMLTGVEQLIRIIDDEDETAG